MKIGILTSSNDMLTLFSFLHQKDHEYVVWYDDASGFWGDLSEKSVIDRVRVGMDFLLSKSVDIVIVPPVIELLLNAWTVDYTSKIKVLPLFSDYVMKKCLPFSLVGKIGLIWDYLDIRLGQDHLKKLTSTYVLAENQAKIKKFHMPLVWRSKEVRLWKPLLEQLSRSSILVNSLIKNDLKYFKDAAVDTLIPMNYSYFAAQKNITHLLSTKKIRFHGLEKLASVFEELTTWKTSTYSVSIFYTGHGEFLTRNKRLLWMLDKGKSGKLNIQKI